MANAPPLVIRLTWRGDTSASRSKVLRSEKVGKRVQRIRRAVIDQIIRIRGLLHAGLPIRVIMHVLPCLKAPREIHFADATPEIIAVLARERDRMTERIDFLTRNRDAIREYLNELSKCSSAV
jgi:DNA-binding transcriptional MerR regulator